MVIAHTNLEAIAMGLWGIVEGSEHIARWCFLCDNPHQREMIDIEVCVEAGADNDTLPICYSCVAEYLQGEA